MIQSLLQRTKKTKELKPPRSFTPAGKVSIVELATEPPFITAAKKGKQRGKKLKGIQYEQRVNDELEKEYGYLYVPGPWLKFLTEKSDVWRLCQPDGLFVDLQSLHISIIEIKLRHTSLAWWQTRRLYEPVVKALFGREFSYNVCEVVRWYDVQTEFPESYALSSTAYRKEAGRFFVHIFNR